VPLKRYVTERENANILENTRKNATRNIDAKNSRNITKNARDVLRNININVNITSI